ncbi:hypothetical protein GQ53DRAFT_441090 [Thozetella sp. PMI_491]|nr:hypothetical protein GQ53DRAFT_441090 [Thozetella sp. PMI_491]
MCDYCSCWRKLGSFWVVFDCIQGHYLFSPQAHWVSLEGFMPSCHDLMMRSNGLWEANPPHTP